MSELPKGWVEKPINKCCDRLRGVTYKKESATYIDKVNYKPILRANNIQEDKITVNDLIYVPEAFVSSKQLLKRFDVIVAMSSGSKKIVGKTAQVLQNFDGSFGAFCGVLRPNKNIDPKYFGYFFRTAFYRNSISDLSAGTNINNLKSEYFDQIQIPIAPLNEQKRIVEKLDRLLTQVDESKKRLEKIPVILKRFRQSVLNAAVTGELTKDWREENPAYENDIIRELKIYTNDLEFDDKGWYNTKIGNIFNMFSGGTPSKSVKDYWSGKIAWVSSGDVKQNEMYEGSEFITQEGLDNSAAKLCPVNSVIVVVRSGILKHTLPIALVKKEFAINQDIKCLNSGNNKLNKWLHLFLQGNAFDILLLNREGTTVQSVKSETLKNYNIGFPGTEEQKEIVKRVETLFKKADEIEERYKKAKAYVDKLTQSILAKAFRGELVPQDPNDEPAEKLLERIREEREKLGAIQKKNKK